MTALEPVVTGTGGVGGVRMPWPRLRLAVIAKAMRGKSLRIFVMV